MIKILAYVIVFRSDASTKQWHNVVHMNMQGGIKKLGLVCHKMLSIFLMCHIVV